MFKPGFMHEFYEADTIFTVCVFWCVLYMGDWSHSIHLSGQHIVLILDLLRLWSHILWLVWNRATFITRRVMTLTLSFVTIIDLDSDFGVFWTVCFDIWDVDFKIRVRLWLGRVIFMITAGFRPIAIVITGLWSLARSWLNDHCAQLIWRNLECI